MFTFKSHDMKKCRMQSKSPCQHSPGFADLLLCLIGMAIAKEENPALIAQHSQLCFVDIFGKNAYIFVQSSNGNLAIDTIYKGMSISFSFNGLRCSEV